MRIHRFLPLLAILSLAGCESDSTAPALSVDAALDLMAGGGVAVYSAAAIAASSPGAEAAFTPPSSVASGCGYNATSQFFVCTPVTRNGVTFTRRFQLLDASGSALTAPDPLAVTAVRSVTDVEGSTTSSTAVGPTTLEIARHEDATLSGIRTRNRLLNGSSTQRIAISGSSISLVSNDTSTTANLKLPVSSTEKWPLGGTITTDRTFVQSLGATTTPSRHSHEVITFDGTSVMTVAITTTAGTRSCKVDLANPRAVPVCR